jgi:hypothetical protein
MNAAAASAVEFGTGLRARLERRETLDLRPAAPPSRDLFRLWAPERPSAPEFALVGRDPAVRGAWGTFAA